jgi:hypothetical protein
MEPEDKQPGASHCEAHNQLLTVQDRLGSMSQAELNAIVPERVRAIMAGCQQPNAYTCPHTQCPNHDQRGLKVACQTLKAKRDVVVNPKELI